MKKVSIIIPTYNTGILIRECIETIKNQSYSNYEVIIIDDGCVDDTIKIAREAINNDSRFYIIKNTKKGVSSARNYGICKSTGEYVTFVDADDKISKKFIETLVELIEIHNCDCSSICVNSSKIDDCCTVNYNIKVYDDVEKYSVLSGEKINSEGYVCNKLYKRNIIKKNKLKFDESISIGEDLLFNNNYFKYSKGFVRSEAPLYFYRLNANSSVNRLDNDKWFDLLKVYEKIFLSHSNEKIVGRYKYNYSLLILEAQYRYNWCKEVSYSYEDIAKLKKIFVRLNKNYSFKQNFKLFIFILFPKIAMKYKRRKVGK